MKALVVACGLFGCNACGGSQSHTPDDASSFPDAAGPALGPLKIDAQNPRYFNNGTNAVYLTGSHTWSNFKDRAHIDPPPAFDYANYLDFLVAHHHNVFRLWTWEQPHSFDDDPNNLLYFAQFAWPRTGPAMANDGKPAFDLDQFDASYFTRMRDRIAAARDRGIYVVVMLFDGWDLANAYNASNGGFPFGAGNNINGVATTGPQAITLANAAITARQEAYVRHVLETVNDLDNVLIEIANETDTTGVAWQHHMVDFAKSVEAGLPKHHLVGMTSTYPGTDADLYASHADWISPNDPNAMGDGRKVLLNDTDHSYGWTQLKGDGVAAQRAWAWGTLCRGSQPMFMDPYLYAWAGRNNPSGDKVDTQWDPLREAMGWTRVYAERLNLSKAVPSASLCSTGACLADPGKQYLVYQPSSGPFMLTVLAGTYNVEWFNPTTNRVVETSTITLGAEVHMFTPPFMGDAVLLLTN